MAYTGDVTVGGPPETRELPGLTVTKLAVGPMDNNAYLLTCTETGEAALIDAANEAGRLLELIGDRPLRRIITTHRHFDHWQALAEVQEATGADVIAHPDDAVELPVPVTTLVENGGTIPVGTATLSVIHLRGHTPGSIALCYDAGGQLAGEPHLFTGRLAVPRRPGQHAGRRETVHPADGRPGGAGLRPAARPHLGVPGARDGHHARRRAAASRRVAGPRLVTGVSGSRCCRPRCC